MGVTVAGDFVIARINVYQKPIKQAATSCAVVVVVVGVADVWSGEEAPAPQHF